jgi:hypothetical protein
MWYEFARKYLLFSQWSGISSGFDCRASRRLPQDPDNTATLKNNTGLSLEPRVAQCSRLDSRSQAAMGQALFRKLKRYEYSSCVILALLVSAVCIFIPFFV